jgi:phosphatidylglycerophosphate synthase
MSLAAALAGAVLIMAGGSWGWLAAAACCQLRLVCNLLDGMVAVEGGLGGPDGAFWNEVPDRASDIALLSAAGVAAGTPWLGMAAAAGAVLTAYVREFGRAEGLTPDYRGPMGKPQRMAILTVALLIAAAMQADEWGALILWAALWVILAGTGVTAVRRSAGIVMALRSRQR